MPGDVKKTKNYDNGCSFVVVVNDILNEPTDGIVNAANGRLAHGGGVARVIAEAAGDDLYVECKDIILNQKEIPVGKAVLTTAGDLPFKGVIHAVGPRMGDGDEGGKIKKALLSAFHLAQDRAWSSISFPGISSGIFSVPHPICARAYIDAVNEFFKQNPDTRLKTIHLCLFIGPLLDTVLEIFESTSNK